MEISDIDRPHSPPRFNSFSPVNTSNSLETFNKYNSQNCTIDDNKWTWFFHEINSQRNQYAVVGVQRLKNAPTNSFWRLWTMKFVKLLSGQYQIKSGSGTVMAVRPAVLFCLCDLFCIFLQFMKGLFNAIHTRPVPASNWHFTTVFWCGMYVRIHC